MIRKARILPGNTSSLFLSRIRHFIPDYKANTTGEGVVRKIGASPAEDDEEAL